MNKDTKKSKELNREELGDVAGGIANPVSGVSSKDAIKEAMRLASGVSSEDAKKAKRLEKELNRIVIEYGVPPFRFPRKPKPPEGETEIEIPDLMPQGPIHFAPKD